MTTTQSNKITAIMAYLGEDLDIKDRKVRNNGDLTTIMLHDKICMTIDRVNKQLIIDGNTPPTRKSVKLINTVLDKSDVKVFTQKGKWKLVTSETINDFNGQHIRINIENCRYPQKRSGKISLGSKEDCHYPYKGKRS